MPRYGLICSLLIPLLIVPASVRSQSTQWMVPSWALDAPLDTRSMAMGLTGTGDASRPGNSSHNPALIAFYRGTWISGGLDAWEGDHNHFDFQLAGGAPLGEDNRLGLAGALSHARADVRVYEPGQRIKSGGHESYMTAAIAMGYASGPVRFSVGGAVKWSTSDNPGERTLYDAGAAVELAAVFAKRWRGRLGIGAGRRNGGLDPVRALREGDIVLVSQSADEDRAGVGISVEWYRDEPEVWRNPDSAVFSLALNVDGSDGDARHLAAGAEVGVGGRVFVRGGYRDDLLPGVHARCLGLGYARTFAFFHMAFDYAYVGTSGDVTHAHSFGTNIGFDY